MFLKYTVKIGFHLKIERTHKMSNVIFGIRASNSTDVGPIIRTKEY